MTEIIGWYSSGRNDLKCFVRERSLADIPVGEVIWNIWCERLFLISHHFSSNRLATIFSYQQIPCKSVGSYSVLKMKFLFIWIENDNLEDAAIFGSFVAFCLYAYFLFLSEVFIKYIIIQKKTLNLRNISALAVNYCVIIHYLEVSCKEDQITSAQREWFIFTQPTDKQWIITQQFTH